jgi:hypothetical protein
MKVVCIDNCTLSGSQISGLTLGKSYDSTVSNNTTFNGSSLQSNLIYKIIDDNGNVNWYNGEVLIPIENYRQIKLKELGI